MVMAGGKGQRLAPLTTHRSKPAVPFGSRYRIIDFVLSNFVNSGYRQLYVLTQYMASSLIEHINRNWRSPDVGHIDVVPAQMRTGESWYLGTADSVYQNLNLIRDRDNDLVAVFGGDHIYQFDVAQMEAAHRARGADITVAAFPVPRTEASSFGVIDIDDQQRITRFLEKPSDPPGMPNRPDFSLVSMGNYFINRDVLEHALLHDADDSESSHDFGRNIIPRLLREGKKLYIYDFADNKIPGEAEGQVPYWRDVGTIDSYFLANMELRARLPALNVYNRHWPIRAAQRHFPPARFVRPSEAAEEVELIDSMVCEGSIVSSAKVSETLLGYDCFVHQGSSIEFSVINSGCDIGARARLRKVLFDKNCKVDPGVEIGIDPESDRKRFPFITESGIVVLPKGTYVPKEGPLQLAYDVEELLRKDPHLAEGFERIGDNYTVSDVERHSNQSAGPRFRRFAGIDDPS